MKSVLLFSDEPFSSVAFRKHKFPLLIPFGNTTGVVSVVVSSGEDSMTKCCVFVSI